MFDKLLLQLSEKSWFRFFTDGLITSLRFLLSSGQSSKKTIIIAVHRVGDSCLCINAVKYLIEYGENECVILCSKGIKALYNRVGINCSIVEIDFAEFYSYRCLASLKNIMKSELKGNTVFDFTATKYSALFILLSGAGDAFGSNHILFRKIYRKFTTIRNTPQLADLYYDIVKLKHNACHLSGNPVVPATRDSIRKIAINPHSGWVAKEWRLFRFIKLAGLLKEIGEVSFVVAANSLQPGIISEIKSEGINVTVTNSIEELYQYLQGIDLFVSPDTGPVHIAALAGCYTFTLYGPTNPEFSQSEGGGHFVYRKQLFCTPDKLNYCFTVGGRNCRTFDCMDSISTDEVYRAVKSAIHNLSEAVVV